MSLPEVLDSCRRVTAQARSVTIDAPAVERWADGCLPEWFGTVEPPAELQFEGSAEDGANLTLLLDCLNFCFWLDEPWSVEYRGRRWTRTYAMYAGVLRAIERDPDWLEPERWVEADRHVLADVFRGQGCIPLLEQRQAVLNETGRVLLERFGGRFQAAVAETGGRALPLARLLAAEFDSFADVTSYRGAPVALLKRAQICAADLHHLWTRQGQGGLTGIEELTVFADYRLPQYLRHTGVLVVEPNLADRIETQTEIAAGSAEEVELRAATVVAGEMLRAALDERGRRVPAWQIDFVLWDRSHDPEVRVAHHRTRTIFY